MNRSRSPDEQRSQHNTGNEGFLHSIPVDPSSGTPLPKDQYVIEGKAYWNGPEGASLQVDASATHRGTRIRVTTEDNGAACESSIPDSVLVAWRPELPSETCDAVKILESDDGIRVLGSGDCPVVSGTIRDFELTISDGIVARNTGKVSVEVIFDDCDGRDHTYVATHPSFEEFWNTSFEDKYETVGEPLPP